MDKNKIESDILEILSVLFVDSNFGRDILEIVDLIDDLGMDSITFMSLIVEIEAQFDIIIPNDLMLMENFRYIDNIVRIVEQLQ